MKLLADTNIFGIAVDRGDERRKSVWETFEKVTADEIELHTAELVRKEIKENPHGPTRQKEFQLLENLVTVIHPYDKKAKDLSKDLENKTDLDVVDSKIVSIAIVNDLTFWSGDRYILREELIREVRKVLEGLDYEFEYKKE